MIVCCLFSLLNKLAIQSAANVYLIQMVITAGLIGLFFSLFTVTECIITSLYFLWEHNVDLSLMTLVFLLPQGTTHPIFVNQVFTFTFWFNSCLWCFIFFQFVITEIIDHLLS